MNKSAMTLQTDKTLCRIMAEGDRRFSAEINGEIKVSGTLDDAWYEIKEYIDDCMYPNRLTNKHFGMLTVPPTCYEDFEKKYGTEESIRFFLELTQEINRKIADKLRTE